MKNRATLQFLGASGTVTGSKYILKTPELNIMIDCGMYQGLKELRQLNWQELPIDVSSVDFVLLTHGHLDHVGYLPRLLKQGFTGKILGTDATLKIAEIILFDSAKIHEEEAERANKEKYTKHSPALPFYKVKDVENTIRLFKQQTEGEWYKLSEHVSFRFMFNGHIIGATFIELDIFDKRFVFSGDIGRTNDYLLDNPKRPEWADILLVEGTYGNKLHPKEDVEEIISLIVREVIQNRGTLIIPSFAVERLQTLMFILWRMYKKNKIPNIPIFVDSPMGNNVLEVFKAFPIWHKLNLTEYNAMCNHFNIVQSYKETWETIDNKQSKIVIAGSGMVTGGRVLTYLQQLIDNPSTTVLMAGYQAEGTRGRQLLDGAHEIKLFGKYYSVKAQILNLDSISAHADQSDLISWMNDIKNIPEVVYLVHGEASSLDAFRVKIKDTYHWNVKIPHLFQEEIIKL